MTGLARKEATQTDVRTYQKQFQEAKQAEYKSLLDHDVFELVDMRKVSVKNYVTGRWVLTVKKTKGGHLEKCKVRWALRLSGQTEGRTGDRLSHCIETWFQIVVPDGSKQGV